ncbi:hypothetical protein EZS27_042817, partial [termite gut metagenome]
MRKKRLEKNWSQQELADYVNLSRNFISDIENPKKITRTRLTDFIKERYNLSDIALKEINHLFIKDFEVYLRTTCGCNSNTTAKFMQFFKRIILLAKNNGWIVADPFANYKIHFAQVDRGYLTQEEIEVIMNKPFATKRLEQVRDIFVFSCFSGLAY